MSKIIKMSKKELQKWENKLKLYVRLHPEIKTINACGPFRGTRCGKGDPEMDNGCFRYCLVLNKNDKLILVDYLHYANYGDLIACVEWIRHV
jgi:hypothetical protein